MSGQTSIPLTKEEVRSLFGFEGINPASQLREKQKQINAENHELIM